MELDERLDAWRNRPIGEITYLVLDATYEKIRHDGAVRSCAVLTVIGIDTDGKRSVIGSSVQLSEVQPHTLVPLVNPVPKPSYRLVQEIQAGQTHL